MKKIVILSLISLFIVSCNAGKEGAQVRRENKIAEKALQAESTAKSVESRKFVLRMDRMYASKGGMFYLVPRRNYLIIDDYKAKMSLAYVGRSYDVRGIAGINMTGETERYEVIRKNDKGVYEINMSLKQGATKFDLFLTVYDNGNCFLSLNNGRIESVRYSGTLAAMK